MSRIPVLLASLCLVGLARSEDRFVNPFRPDAFPTLQAAHDAANPGDRLIVEVDLPWAGLTKITKSLTIESADALRKTLPYISSDANSSHRGEAEPGMFLISGLTPGRPLVLRSLAFRFYRTPGSSRDTVGIRTEGHLAGAIHLDNVSVDNGDLRVDLPVTLMDVDVSLLWVHYTRMVCQDSLPIPGIGPLGDNTGSDCLVARVRQLVIEDSELWAGSAPFIRYVEGFYQQPFGGRGGIALVAPTDATVVTRTVFADGNGGSVETGPWTVAPVLGTKGVSQWIGTGGLFEGWESVQVPGLGGQLVAVQDPIRDVSVIVDEPFAPLHICGNALIGGMLQFDVSLTSSDPAMVLVGTRWSFVPVPGQGILWIDPARFVTGITFIVSSSVVLPLPNDPALLGTPVIGQPVSLGGGRLMNPSAMMIR